MITEALFAVATACAPNVAPSTLHSLIAAESDGNPLAININGGARLKRQPSSRAEAIAWARWLRANNVSFDAGLMQINVKNWAAYGVTSETAFDPCNSARVGGAILTDAYVRAVRQFGPGQRALLAAISAYNTGGFSRGFANGYVNAVLRKAGVAPTSAPPLERAAPEKLNLRFAASARSAATVADAAPSAPTNWQSPAHWGDPMQRPATDTPGERNR